ncbi:hypothetical protein GCM10010329_80710 [Streptomyces spiroverticillatus]|uniref:Uncharacterized protein n=1 Tax=Streptomyces finlayi TaxID=67296 RepID=A0A918X744_9ACTN|nr:hypothetical protein [Streptomyces finlayi]GHA45960.1 hypothetical protein GCM10010329_80710 [Streptomyces spiroverticillatus]GHD16014.1 hypothetical protein GCM10010334_76630 [Streptomyces finlayi]
MQSDDKPVNGQNNPSFLDLLHQTPPTKDNSLDKDTGTTRLARLRAGWEASWEQGGFLYGRWEELRLVPKAGWHGVARWIKALLVLAGVCALLILLDTAGDIFGAALSRLADSMPATRAGTSAVGELWGVVDNPIRSYIDQHSVGLSVSGSAVYAFWQLVGLFGLAGGFLGSTGARITWACWGAVSVLAVWSAAPADGRTVAAGIAVLAWTLASTLALRGWSLRPVVNNFLPLAPAFQPQIEIRPEIHLPASASAPDDDTPDNVHQLQH